MTEKLHGIVPGLPEHEYHARPELSSTEARLILDSPAKYRWKKDHPPLVEPSKKFDVGSAVHSKVLGTGYEAVVIPPDYLATNGAASTTAAKTFIAEARAAGKIPLKIEEFEPIDQQAEAVLAHPAAKQLFAQPATAEVSVFATDPETGIDVRGRFDFLPNDFTLGAPSRVAVDLKTARDASPAGFTKSIADYQYDVQRSWYLDALKWVTGEDAEMVFVAVEKEPPYLVAVHQLPTIWVEMGRTKARRAREVYAECVASGEWPGYGNQVHLLSPPTWLVMKHSEEYPND
jgi:hypothetical protein